MREVNRRQFFATMLAPFLARFVPKPITPCGSPPHIMKFRQLGMTTITQQMIDMAPAAYFQAVKRGYFRTTNSLL